MYSKKTTRLTLISFILLLLIALLVSVVANSQDEQLVETNGETSVVGTEGLGEGLTAKEMIDYHIDLTRGETAWGIADMTIVTPDWERTVGMEWWESGKDLMLLRILSPARDEGNGTLKIETNLWNYIYAFDETVHIPPAMMMQSWMGSDFTNDDLIRESSLVDDYEQVLEGIEEIDGERCYSVLMTTDPSTPVPWLTLRIWLRTGDLIPVRQEYYDDDGELAKYMIFSDFEFMFDRVIPLRMRMVPLDREGHYTEMLYKEAEFDIELDEDIFTLRNLQNP